MGLGSLYILYLLGDELLNHAALAKAEMGVVGWAPLAIMWMGVINCISCLPMSKFSKGAYLRVREPAWKAQRHIPVSHHIQCHRPNLITHAGPTGGYDTKGAGFKGLGIGMTMLGIWTAYFFSGHYPAIVGAAVIASVERLVRPV